MIFFLRHLDSTHRSTAQHVECVVNMPAGSRHLPSTLLWRKWTGEYRLLAGSMTACCEANGGGTGKCVAYRATTTAENPLTFKYGLQLPFPKLMSSTEKLSWNEPMVLELLKLVRAHHLHYAIRDSKERNARWDALAEEFLAQFSQYQHHSVSKLRAKFTSLWSDAKTKVLEGTAGASSNASDILLCSLVCEAYTEEPVDEGTAAMQTEPVRPPLTVEVPAHAAAVEEDGEEHERRKLKQEGIEEAAEAAASPADDYDLPDLPELPPLGAVSASIPSSSAEAAAVEGNNGFVFDLGCNAVPSSISSTSSSCSLPPATYQQSAASAGSPAATGAADDNDEETMAQQEASLPAIEPTEPLPPLPSPATPIVTKRKHPLSGFDRYCERKMLRILDTAAELERVEAKCSRLHVQLQRQERAQHAHGDE